MAFPSRAGVDLSEVDPALFRRAVIALKIFPKDFRILPII